MEGSVRYKQHFFLNSLKRVLTEIYSHAFVKTVHINRDVFLEKALPNPPNRLHAALRNTVPLYHPYFQGAWRKINSPRSALLSCAWIAATTMIINVAVTVWASSVYGIERGLGTLYRGDCKRVESFVFWIHLGINLLSTLLVGASNYSMQCLSFPTRDEIDKAHSRKFWLDIGVPSLRNLRRISPVRTGLWCLLALSSIPLHLLYNSAIFSSLCTRSYFLVVILERILSNNLTDIELDPGHYWLTDITLADNETELAIETLRDTIQSYQQNKSILDKLTNEDCIRQYTSQIISRRSDVFLVNKMRYPDDDLYGKPYFNYSSLLTSSLVASVSGGTSMNQWKCLDAACTTASGPQHMQISEVLQHASAWTINDLGVDYCLSQPVPEQCRLQFSLAIMIVVVACNFVKLVCFCIILWKRHWKPLVTLGDAIASFLDRPDPTTIERRTRERGGLWPQLHSKWRWGSVLWLEAPSQRRWLLCNTL